MSDYAVSMAITGLMSGEIPVLTICVPLDGTRGGMTEQILSALFGNVQEQEDGIKQLRDLFEANKNK